MAGLFSLGGGGGSGGRGNDVAEDQHQQNEIPPPDHSSLFWYTNKNDDVVSSSYRGFEIWNQHQQNQQQLVSQSQPRSFFQQADLYSSAAALGVGPSEASRSGLSGSGGGGGSASCQDCGNQAKKDCPHVRCRTCCKSRGFDCQTHLKSTWVPASKRRERQQQQQQLVPSSSRSQQQQRDQNPSSSSLACTLLPPNPSQSGGLEEVNFPPVVSAPAEFKCVRVSSVDDAEEEYAYSTAVNIGGHVFRGILYDYGPDGNSYAAAGRSSSSGGGGGVGVAQPLNLISAAGPTAAVGALVDPSSLYPAPLNAFMPSSGTQFFPHPRP